MAMPSASKSNIAFGRLAPTASGTVGQPMALPASLAPFREMRPLRAERRVVAVAGINPGPVGQRSEDFLFEAVHQAGEGVRVVERVSRPSGKQAVAREQVWCVRELAGGVVQQRDRTGGMTNKVDGPQACIADPYDVTVVDELRRGHGQRPGVV